MHASEDSLPAETMGDSYEGHFADWGEYMAYFESIKGGTDFSPLFVGLPDDMCQSPHWGYLFKGKLRSSTRTTRRSSAAGEAYYAPPGPHDRMSRGRRDSGVLANGGLSGDHGGGREKPGGAGRLTIPS